MPKTSLGFAALLVKEPRRTPYEVFRRLCHFRCQARDVQSQNQCLLLTIYTIPSVRRHTLSGGASPCSLLCLMHSCACLPAVVLSYPVQRGSFHKKRPSRGTTYNIYNVEKRRADTKAEDVGVDSRSKLGCYWFEYTKALVYNLIPALLCISS